VTRRVALDPDGHAHIALTSFLFFTLPLARASAVCLSGPVCCVAVVSDLASGAATVQLTGDTAAPRTQGEIRALLSSLPAQTILAWLL
jgi:hypothetical protein